MHYLWLCTLQSVGSVQFYDYLEIFVYIVTYFLAFLQNLKKICVHCYFLASLQNLEIILIDISTADAKKSVLYSLMILSTLHVCSTVFTSSKCKPLFSPVHV